MSGLEIWHVRLEALPILMCCICIVTSSLLSRSQWPTVPQLYVKGEFIGGADILNEMEESGELKKLFAGVK